MLRFLLKRVLNELYTQGTLSFTTLETKEWRNLWARLARTIHKALRSAANGERLVILTFCQGRKHRGYMLRFLLKRVLNELYDLDATS